MERVRGIGGVFFKAKDPKALGAWYQQHLGVNLSEWGGATFRWKDDDHDGNAVTAWNVFDAGSDYFPKPFMVNFRVKSLERMLAQLRAAGAQVDDKVDQGEFGNFGWVTDPEGNRVELWEPPHEKGGPAPTPPAGPESEATVDARPKAAKKPAAVKKPAPKKKKPAPKKKKGSRK